MADAPPAPNLRSPPGRSAAAARSMSANCSVAMREIDLEPSRGEPPVASTTPPAPTPIPQARIDIMAGLPELRRDWILARGDVEEVAQREVRPEDNGQLGPDRSRRRPALPQRRASACLRAKPGANVSQMHYARRGIITPEMEYVADPRESRPRGRARAPRATAKDFGAAHPRLRHPRIRPRRGRPRPRDHPHQHQPPRSRADGDRPQLPGQDQRQHRQLRGRLRRRRRGRQDGLVDPLGRRHGDGPLAPAATSTTPANGSSATRPCRSAPCRSTRRWRRSAASPRT